MQCPRCESSDVSRAGRQNGKYKYFCNGCQRHFLDSYDPNRNEGNPNYSAGTRDQHYRWQDETNEEH